MRLSSRDRSPDIAHFPDDASNGKGAGWFQSDSPSAMTSSGPNWRPQRLQRGWDVVALVILHTDIKSLILLALQALTWARTGRRKSASNEETAAAVAKSRLLKDPPALICVTNGREIEIFAASAGSRSGPCGSIRDVLGQIRIRIGRHCLAAIVATRCNASRGRPTTPPNFCR
jgi:hypothetical protein